MSKCLDVFHNELALISDEKIRSLVQRIFDAICPEYFWHIPASQRGHHPPICQTTGGLVHHTKLAVRFADSFMDMWPNAPEESYDEVIAAVLLHDMEKRGYCEDELATFDSHKDAVVSHGLFCASQIRTLMQISNNRCGVPMDRINRIITAVRDHMGRWTKNYVRSQSAVEKNISEGHVVCITTHLADYAASRDLHKFLGERYLDSRGDNYRP